MHTDRSVFMLQSNTFWNVCTPIGVHQLARKIKVGTRGNKDGHGPADWSQLALTRVPLLISCLVYGQVREVPGAGAV
jgi:hypothetical protein